MPNLYHLKEIGQLLTDDGVSKVKVKTGEWAPFDDNPDEAAPAPARIIVLQCGDSLVRMNENAARHLRNLLSVAIRDVVVH